MDLSFFFGLLAVLLVLALVGHGIWVLARSALRGIAWLIEGARPRPLTVEICPRCREVWDPFGGRCDVCGWSPHGDAPPYRASPNRTPHRLRQQIERYRQLGLLAPEVCARLLDVLTPGGAPAAPRAEVAAPPPSIAPEAKEPEPIRFIEAHAPKLPEPVPDLADRVRSYRKFLDESPVEKPPAAPRPQRVLSLLSAFLEEKSIRWGELVGGLLIVGCSLALVISFWSSIAERPFLKYGLFYGVTALLFGLGFHAERSWKLPTTALGLLIIAALLTPLNFLAVASLVRGTASENVWGLGAELVAAGVFAVLLLRAGRSLVAAAPWTLLVGVLVPSASMLLARRSLGPGAGVPAFLALGALPMLAQGGALGGWIARTRRAPGLDEGAANELLRLLGLSTFAAALVLGLLIAHGGPMATTLPRLAALTPLAGASILIAGMVLWRRVDAEALVGYRTAGTAIAAAGTLVLLSGIALAWPDPARVLPVALLDGAILAALALGLNVPAAHVLAGACLIVAYQFGWLVVRGRLGWWGASSEEVTRALLSGGAGSALVPLVLVFGGLAAAGLRVGRRLDAQALAVVGALAGLGSVGLVTWSIFDPSGDSAGATWVYGVYALAALGFGLWFGRYPLVDGTDGKAEATVLGWAGSALLLASLMHAMVLGGWTFGLGLSGVAALLAHSGCCIALCLLLPLPRWDRFRSGQIVREILDRSALAGSIVAAWGIGAASLAATAPSLAANLCGLALIWLALAWRHGSPALFAAFQGALTGAVVGAVATVLRHRGWYLRSPSPNLDPWTLQAAGGAVGVLALGWIGLRLAVRARGGGRFVRLIDPPWPAFDRYVRGALVALAVGLAVYGVVPGAARELTPRALAVQLQGATDTSSGRVVAPVSAFEIDRIPHAHALGAGSWAVLGLTVLVLLAGQWERSRPRDLLAALLVASMAAPLLAGRWEASVAAASALRWSGALVLCGTSALIWSRGRLAGWGRRLGWEIEEGPASEATALVLALGMLPLMLMAGYVGLAALDGGTAGADPSAAGYWGVALLVTLGLPGFGLWWAPAGERPRGKAAGMLLMVLGALPMVAVSVFAVSAALVGNPIAGPDPGSFFRRLGNAGSYVPPILLVAATLVGFAARERSTGFGLAAGLVLNVAATAGYLMAGAKGGLAFDAALCIRLAQLNALASAAYALAWTGAVAACRRRDGLPATSVALAVALNLAVVVGGTLALLFDPTPAPALGSIAGPWGLAALGVTVAAVVVRARVAARSLALDWLGLAVVAGAAFLALGLAARDPGDWRAYHGMLAGQALAGILLPMLAWRRAGLSLAGVPGDLRAAVGRWSTLALGVVAVFSIRAYWTDPQSPWWTLAGLASMAALAAALAVWTRVPGFLKLGCGLLNLAATFLCYASATWARGPGEQTGWGAFINVNVIALAFPVPLWLWIDRRVTWPRRRPRFPRAVAWVALGLFSLVVLWALGSDADFGPIELYPLLGWGAIAATAVALAAGSWDERSRGTMLGLYALGLGAAGWGVHQVHPPPGWLDWIGTMVLAAYSVATSYLWSRRAALGALADRVGLPHRDDLDPLAGLAWLVPANLLLAALVMMLAFGTILTETDANLRALAANAALAQGLALGLLAQGARRSPLQMAALLAGVAGLIAFGWSWTAPDDPNGTLDRLADVLAALVGAGVLYGIGLAKLLPGATEWAGAARRLVPTLLGLSGMTLAIVLGVEVSDRLDGSPLAMSRLAVGEVALTLAGAIAAALFAALVPGRDPLGLSERGRTAYVYGSEVLLALLAGHLKMAFPWLFTGFFLRYWPLLILGLSFLGVSLSELFRRQGRAVLAEPLERTGALLPVLPLLAAFGMVPRPGEDVLFLVLLGGLYTTLALLRSSLTFGALAALACNGALWAWLGHHDALGLLSHPQLWVVPPAACVLIGASLNRDKLSQAQVASIRYAASLAIYLASTADIVLTGVAQAPWLPLVLAALSIAGIFAGIWLRVRGFLFLGLGFLTLALFSIIWYAAVDLRQTWLWAASGIVAGMAILAVFALFEKKRQDVLRVVDQIKEWSP